MPDNYSLLNLILSVIVILVSVVSMTVSIVQSVVSQELTREANKISKIALETVQFSHKIQIIPNLTLSFFVIDDIPSAGKLIWLSLVNTNFGKASIKGFKTSGQIASLRLVSKNEPPTFPFTLSLNKEARFAVEINPAVYDESSIKREAKLNNATLAEWYYQTFFNIMASCFFTIHYTNETGIEYITYFDFDYKRQEYVGVPIEQ